MRLCRGLLLVTSLSFVSPAVAQEASTPQHAIEDWSTRHVVFTGLTPENVSEVAKADPRAWSVWRKHARYQLWPVIDDTESGQGDHRHRRRPPRAHGEKRFDWQVSLGSTVGPWASPAKFSFDINAQPDCTNDYVVFPTNAINTPGSTLRASLIAFNNLYTGPGPSGICPSPASPASQPSVLFAYNVATTTDGVTPLSPVLSLDGKKIAFIENNIASGGPVLVFHVLTWKAGEGTSWSTPAVPGDCSPGNSCLISLDLSDTFGDSRSNPFVDYAHDTAYVGDNMGFLHKITPVFNGVPQEVTTNGWPLRLPSSPQSPVYDSVSGRILVTDVNSCALYVIDAASASLLATKTFSCSDQSDVIVDSTDQTAFVVLAAFPSFELTALQFDSSGTLLAQTPVGALGGNVNVFSGAFDHQYFSSPSLGHFYLAGALNGIASICSVGFTAGIMNTSFNGPLPLTTTGFTSIPLRLTEIYNPSFSNGPDRLFLPIDENCGPSLGGDGDGCIESVDVSNGFPTSILNSYLVPTGGAMFSISGLIVDNVSSSAQASSIYFEVGPPYVAIKLTQAALQ